MSRQVYEEVQDKALAFHARSFLAETVQEYKDTRFMFPAPLNVVYAYRLPGYLVRSVCRSYFKDSFRIQAARRGFKWVAGCEG